MHFTIITSILCLFSVVAAYPIDSYQQDSSLTKHTSHTNHVQSAMVTAEEIYKRGALISKATKSSSPTLFFNKVDWNGDKACGAECKKPKMLEKAKAKVTDYWKKNKLSERLLNVDITMHYDVNLPRYPWKVSAIFYDTKVLSRDRVSVILGL
ncbi:hypothetical protein BYT27DRAFT_7243698 [Phlegmacium glaucopus]|nr:hypothetical protein BYT27DRAFT_7243698 [Phlegmacium glaucopus]